MIRPAKTEDLPAIIAAGKRLKSRTEYAHVTIDVRRVGETLGQCICSALGFAVVAEHDGKIGGFMLGVAQPIWFSREREAADLITYAERPGDGIRMIRRFVDWGWSVPNVSVVLLAQTSGLDIERARVLYERVGGQMVGNIFTIPRKACVAEEAA